jgi:proline iminopeptidase
VSSGSVSGRRTSAGLYPANEPYEHGVLDVGGGHLVYWETCGSPDGKPALVLHGGPGSGCTPWQRRLFDPGAYRVVLFDQRNCGRSVPHASEPAVDLAGNTTPNLVADVERLRLHLGVERWLLTGGSWGSALALAYGEEHPQRVGEMVLWGVNAARRRDFDWLFRGGVGAFFPQQWERLGNAVPDDRRDVDVVDAYAELLFDRDPEMRRRAAYEWCLWESATPSWPPTSGLDERYRDPAFALAFARLVTHYVRHDAWVPDDALLHGIDALAEIPAVLVQGRFDFQAPLGSAWEIHRAWPTSELVVVDDAGHDSGAPRITEAIVRAIDRFASA